MPTLGKKTTSTWTCNLNNQFIVDLRTISALAFMTCVIELHLQSYIEVTKKCDDFEALPLSKSKSRN